MSILAVALLLALPVGAQTLATTGLPSSAPVPEPFPQQNLVRLEWRDFRPFLAGETSPSAEPSLRFSNRLVYKGIEWRLDTCAFLSNEVPENIHGLRITHRAGNPVPDAIGKDLRLFIGTGISF
ncbi:hypothetical protein [Geothrix sp. PMB-07]|uniref:hypothetical protein n=1 Tax=Geothrix sp. PMB-07 TaxID=3068640 RepID=UPI0027413A9A|nr:hypothetical protein [Geothrix sp. PMB-07]WLT30559.1 hypothetical protein Q9293_12615 [Geothrix sp. PMB-07]